MIDLNDIPGIPELELNRCAERCEKGVLSLAEACGWSSERELERFRWCCSRLGQPSHAQPAAHLLGQLKSLLDSSLPSVFELALTYADGGLRGFGYMTQGYAQQTLPDSMGELLRGVLRLHVETDGPPSEAELLADLFRIAFPGMTQLESFSPNAQAMIVAIVPDDAKTRFKIYFNTRLDPSTPHRERVAALLKRCGLRDDGLYDLLYGNNEGARFHGIGVDLDGSNQRRAKMYVHIPLERLEPTLKNLATHLSNSGTTTAVEDLLDPVNQQRSAIESEALNPMVEVASALRAGEPPTLKLTTFFNGKRTTEADGERVIEYLNGLGYSSDALSEAMTVLGAGAGGLSQRKYPLSAIGLEVPVGKTPKVNVYLCPVM